MEKMKKAKMHYEALMQALAALGISLAEFEEQMDEGSEEGEEYGEEMGGEEEESEEAPMAGKKGPDKSKVAVIIAKMKNKMKG
jgi:predicted phage tail protein